MKNYIYVLNKNGTPLMPTTRSSHIRKLLKCGKARIVEYNPFTIQLLYESTNYTSNLVVAIDPGRTNIGANVIDEKNLCSLFNVKVSTRNKEIPKLMKERKMHRNLSRNGERKRRQRRAKANNTTFKECENGNYIKERYLPHYEKPIHIRYIKNSESKFCNRVRPKGWLTPTANQLLQTHFNVIRKAQKYLPITSCSIELNKFAFMQMDNPNINNWQYQQGKLFGKESLYNAINEMQENHCLLCKKGIDHYHHIVEQSNGGSDTIDNIAGLCEKHHTLVHKELVWKEKLLTKKQGLMKKYGALSVLNQIIPYLLKEVITMFGENNVFVCSGQDTYTLRNYLSIPKDHNYDAYCIGLMGILQKNNILLDDVVYNDNDYHNNIFDNITSNHYENVQVKHLQQFRRHNRQIIQCQKERTYKLNGEIVAKNRRKRMGKCILVYTNGL